MTVFKDSSSNTWYYNCYIIDNKGNRIRKRKYGYKTKKECSQAENDLINQYKIYSIIPNGNSEITLPQLYKLFMESRTDIKETTIKSYTNVYDNFLLKYFDNDIMIKDINYSIANDFKNYINSLSYKTAYKNIILDKTNALFEFAYNLDYIPTNVFNKVTKNRFKKSYDEKLNEKEKIKAWDYNQFQLFISYFADDLVFKTLFTLLYDTGMRINECRSLTWDKIDLDNNIITVDRQLKGDERVDIEFTSLKNSSSERQLYITNYDVSLLTQLKSAVSSNYYFKESQFVFGGVKPLCKNTIKYQFLKSCKYNNLSNISLHGLRHSHASYLFSNGFDITFISKRLGHANIQTTLNIYTHLLDNSVKQQNSKIEALLKH